MHRTIYESRFFSGLFRALSIVFLKLAGWRRVGCVPDLPKYVMIGAHHTSNWDAPISVAILFSFRIKAYWLMKNTAFRWPFRGLLLWLGAIPVDRTKSADVVGQMAGEMKKRAEMVLLLAPEGTRKKVTRWKSGFYHIARGAGVPVVLAFLDYRQKEGGLGPVFRPTGNFEADMGEILRFYSTVTGKRPERMGAAEIPRG
ncbi:MAG: lysophospholipid acyltransferase family protein [Pseudomonadota bacterium]|jgi:1-acyl-sn-glycerol-3-phosphate acyltransferase|nr:lysophospholipid acyltransferase family protein [Pseudomonadota bacterium]NLX30801.1 glycerol acyltransferase [Deltaproteobacteria bacterium]HNU86283.1 lysophospholipid acyltransferase family protein [Syntrophales bacterium]HOF74605.1 lysophospholipid acyltransferase family protein [Syntrophales bacterium]HPX02812.1 lysophospholipid acyltransferase family protein [Syntrophales bacterium]